MIIEIPNENSIVKWKMNDKEDWKSAEISDLIKAYEESSQGEWVNTSPYDDKGECSRCCYVSKKYYNFCPNCGADMQKSSSEKYTGTAEVSLDCWENNPILLTSNPPKLVWTCRYCGKEITTEVSEIPTTICKCLGESKVMSQDQSSDVDMQIRIIKGDLQYLAEKVNKLSSLIERAEDKEVN